MESCPRCGGELHRHEEMVRKATWRLDGEGVAVGCQQRTTVATYASCSGHPSSPGCGFYEIIDFQQQEAPVQLFTRISFN